MPQNHATDVTARTNNGRVRNRRRRRKSFIPSLFLRIVMIVTLISLTSVVSWAVLLNVSKPYVIGAQQAAELTEKTQNLHRLEAENARLAKQCAFLNQPDGIEYEARLKGYLMPGEQSIVLTPAPNAGH